MTSKTWDKVSSSGVSSQSYSAGVSSVSQESVPHGADRHLSTSRPSSSRTSSLGKMSSGVGRSRSGLKEVQKDDKFFWMILCAEDGAGSFTQATTDGRGAGRVVGVIHVTLER